MRSAILHTLPRPCVLATALSCGIAVLSLLTTSVEAAPKKPRKPKAGKLPPPEMHRDSPRFLNPEEQIQFVQKMAATVSMANRQLDPFCRTQDPDEPIISTTPGGDGPRQIHGAQAVPFADIINRLKINTIRPKEGVFLIGEREYREGGHITLKFRMRPIKAEIVSIKSTNIVFRNTDSNETATLSLDLLPAGMKPDEKGFEVPGLHRNDPDAPVNLDN